MIEILLSLFFCIFYFKLLVLFAERLFRIFRELYEIIKLLKINIKPLKCYKK